jgi:hypothetical protein
MSLSAICRLQGRKNTPPVTPFAGIEFAKANIDVIPQREIFVYVMKELFAKLLPQIARKLLGLFDGALKLGHLSYLGLEHSAARSCVKGALDVTLFRCS